MKNKFDYIIIGSGLAGLTTALTLKNSGSIAIFTKKNPTDSATNLAQGGMAAMVDNGDREKWYVEDTMKAGDYHNKKKAVSFLVKNSQEALLWLKAQGVLFDTKPSLEAGHRLARIFHTTDFTGQDIVATLLNKVTKNKQINIFKNIFIIDLIVKNNICEGVFALTEDNKIAPFFAKAVILATGGSGQVYQWTTNLFVATGDGIAMAKRAGANLSDLEFIQFHPTALKYGISPLFLLSERLRGEGAKLIDEKGDQFVEELIPRDKLAQVVFEKQKTSEVYLTMSHLNKGEIVKKLPNIYKKLKTCGFDLTKDRVPITPAAHYQCGGVTTNLDGRTSVEDLFAVGEVANTGVHGANRLASNSLLEAVVFGKRIGEYIKKNYLNKSFPRRRESKRNIPFKRGDCRLDPLLQGDDNLLNKIKTDIKKIMWEKVGIVRKKNKLTEALNIFKRFKRQLNNLDENRKLFEARNLVEVATIITKSALKRKKSLGAHYIEK